MKFWFSHGVKGNVFETFFSKVNNMKWFYRPLTEQVREGCERGWNSVKMNVLAS